MIKNMNNMKHMKHVAHIKPSKLENMKNIKSCRPPSGRWLVGGWAATGEKKKNSKRGKTAKT